MNIKKRVTECVTMDKVLGYYCPGVKIRGSRIQCPIHNGTRYNCRIWPTSFYCHTCHAHGNVIDFVVQYCHVPEEVAIEQLVQLFLMSTPSQRRSEAKAAEEERKKRERERKANLEFHRKQIRKVVDLRRTIWNDWPDEEAWIDWLDRYLDKRDLGNDTPDDVLIKHDVSTMCINIMLSILKRQIDE